MKNQALFSSEDKSKKLKCRLLQFLFGVLRVNTKLNYKYLQMNYSQFSNTNISILNISNRAISSLHIWNTDISEYPLISQNLV